jgi:hypothetical protein
VIWKYPETQSVPVRVDDARALTHSTRCRSVVANGTQESQWCVPTLFFGCWQRQPRDPSSLVRFQSVVRDALWSAENRIDLTATLSLLEKEYKLCVNFWLCNFFPSSCYLTLNIAANGLHSCFVFGRSRFQISARRPVILRSSVVFPSPSRQRAG